MFKKFSLAVVALVLMAGSAMANDVLDAGSLDIASISDANNAIVEANLDVNVDDLTEKTGDDVAVEACFRRWGGCYGHNYGCYNYSYNYCYPTYSYHYCYQPTFYCYRPVVYHNYCYPLTYWGCY